MRLLYTFFFLFSLPLYADSSLEAFLQNAKPNYNTYYPATLAQEGTCMGIVIMATGLANSTLADQEASVKEVAHLISYNAFSGMPPKPIPKKLPKGELLSPAGISAVASELHNHFMPHPSATKIPPTQDTVINLFIQWIKDNSGVFFKNERALKMAMRTNGQMVQGTDDLVLPLIAFRKEPIFGHALLIRMNAQNEYEVYDPTDKEKKFRKVEFVPGKEKLTLKTTFMDHLNKLQTITWDGVTAGHRIAEMVKITQGRNVELILPRP